MMAVVRMFVHASSDENDMVATVLEEPCKASR